MEILPIGSFDDLKRCWRRKRYQRLEKNATKVKRKLKIARLGNKNNQNELKIKKVPNTGFKILTPIQLVTKFHKAYVDAMVRLGSSKRIDHVKNEAKRGAKCQPIPMSSASTNEMVDSRLVVEMYKRVMSTRNAQSALINPEFY